MPHIQHQNRLKKVQDLDFQLHLSPDTPLGPGRPRSDKDATPKKDTTKSNARPSSGRGKGRRPTSGSAKKMSTKAIEKPTRGIERTCKVSVKRPSSGTIGDFSISKEINNQPIPKRQKTNPKSKLTISTPTSTENNQIPTLSTKRKTSTVKKRTLAKKVDFDYKSGSLTTAELVGTTGSIANPSSGEENDQPNSKATSETQPFEDQSAGKDGNISGSRKAISDQVDEKEWTELKNNTRVSGDHVIYMYIYI